MTTKQAAEYLQLTTGTVRVYAHRGEIKHSYKLGRFVFDIKDLDAWRKERDEKNKLALTKGR